METVTQTITEFLLARIAEDEALLTVPTAKRMIGRKIVETPIERLPQYMERDRERWRAECEAKRRIVARLSRPERCSDPGNPDHYPYQPEGANEREPHGCVACGVEWFGPDPTLRDLASVYADHPDFREEWRA